MIFLEICHIYFIKLILFIWLFTLVFIFFRFIIILFFDHWYTFLFLQNVTNIILFCWKWFFIHFWTIPWPILIQWIFNIAVPPDLDSPTAIIPQQAHPHNNTPQHPLYFLQYFLIDKGVVYGQGQAFLAEV